MADSKHHMWNVFLSNIPHNCAERELQAWVESQGFELTCLRIIRDLVAGVCPGFAYVSIKEPSKLSEAIRALNGQALKGRVISVSEPRIEFYKQRSA